MATSAVLMLVVQGLLLTPKVASLSAITDEGYRLRQHQSSNGSSASIIRKATMDAGGRMEVKPHRHHEQNEDTSSAMMKNLYPYYHTSDEIKAEVIKLSKNCAGALNVTTLQDGDVSIDVATIRKATAKPVNRVFILFGEHSRELISPESGLYFLRALCGDAQLSTNAADVLEDSEFQMVLNSNPRSRKKVESGDFCLRTNPSGVDLNRNWDEEWQNEAAAFGDSSNPGPKPFSEPETRIFKRLVTDYAPDTFLTVHSGTRGMYMPWAYDMKHLANYNEPAMMEVLRTLDKDHCKCPFGAAGKEVGYPCPGTCLDYAYGKLNTPFVFAFEIYTSPDSDEDLKQRWEDKMSSGGQQLLEKGHHLGHPHFRDVFSEHTSDFVELGSSKSGAQGSATDTSLDTGCFDIFNPGSQDEYDKVVKNWAEAYVQMSAMVAKKLRNGEVTKKPATPVQ